MVKQADISEFVHSEDQSGGSSTVRLKHLAEINPTKSEIAHLDPETEVSFVALEDFGTDGEIKDTEIRTLDEVYDGYTYFREGDIAIAKITPSFENGKGAICQGLKNGIGFGTTELHVLRPREGISTEFLWYVLRSKPFIDEAKTAMRGVAGQQRVPTEFLEQYTVREESLRVQQSIVKTLSKEAKKIDTIIEKKGKLKQNLKQRRETVIEAVVTSGVNTCDSYKYPDILGYEEIPEHWEMTKLGWILTRPPKNGLSPPLSSEETGIPTFSISAVDRGQIDVQNNLKYAEITDDEAKQFEIEAGDVLLIRGNGNLQKVGKSGIVSSPVPEKCIYPDILMHLKFRQNIVKKYFVYLINSSAMRPQIEIGARTSTGVWKVSQKTVSGLVVPLPPVEEQRKIVSYLDRVVGKMDDLIEMTEDVQERLREKRQALITAAITGQIDMSEEKDIN